MAIVGEKNPNDTFQTAQVLNLGDTVRGFLSSANDWDYFKLTLGSSGVLKLDFISPVSSAYDYFNIEVVDGSGKQLAYDFVDSSTSLSIGAPVAGNYYVAVTSGSTHYTAAQYGLSVSVGAGSAIDYESEDNGSLAAANPIILEHAIRGQLSSSDDADYFRVTANSAGVLVLDFSAPHVTTDTSCTVAIYDQDGHLLLIRETGSTMSLVVPVAAAGSDYVIQVSQGGALNFDSGNYRLTAHNDSLAMLAAKPLAGAGSIPLTLSSGHDWYSVNLTAGTSYEFSLAGSASGGGTLADPSLTLCYANGASLEACDDLAVWFVAGQKTTTVVDPQIAFTAPITGTYYLMIGGNGGTGSYTLNQKTDTLSSLVQDLLHVQDVPNERWNGGLALGTPVALTYSFMASAADGATDDGESGFAAMTLAQQAIVKNVLAEYGAIANITFTQTANQSVAQIRFGTSYQPDSAGVTYTSPLANDAYEQADVFIDNSTGSPSLGDGSYDLLTLIHETGHALGLKHPGNYNTGSGSSSPPYLPLAWDNAKYTLMSYVDNADASVYGDTPGLLDIAAVQYLYGANTAATGQARTYTFSNNSPFVSSLLSSGSSDTIDISNQSLRSIIFMAPGTLSSLGVDAQGNPAKDNLAVPFGAQVVSVIDGPAADLMVGNALDNTFYESGGNDTIDGGLGTDTVIYGGIRSHFRINKTASTVTVKDDAKINDNLANVEKLQFSDGVITLADWPLPHAKAMTSDQGALIKLYVGVLGLAPNATAMNWAYNLEMVGMNRSFTEMANLFLSADGGAGSSNTYSSPDFTLTPYEFVEKLFANMFGWNATVIKTNPVYVNGVTFWRDELIKSTTPTDPNACGNDRGKLIVDIMNIIDTSTISDPSTVAAQGMLANKLEVGRYYALDLDGDTQNQSILRGIVNGISADQGTAAAYDIYHAAPDMEAAVASLIGVHV